MYLIEHLPTYESALMIVAYQLIPDSSMDLCFGVELYKHLNFAIVKFWYHNINTFW